MEEKRQGRNDADKKQNGGDALRASRLNSPKEAEELCQRCQEKVYPLEKISIGIALHRNCFNCTVCDLKLTLNTFVLAEKPDEPSVKDVYCKAHAPKPVSHEMDPEAVMIKTAVNAQMIRKMANINNLVSRISFTLYVIGIRLPLRKVSRWRVCSHAAHVTWNHTIRFHLSVKMDTFVERGRSAGECRTRNQGSRVRISLCYRFEH